MGASNMAYDEVTTAMATSNIALTKYWGKSDESINLPTNSSISITLDEQVGTRTSVLLSDRISKDILYIDGVREDFRNPKEEKVAFVGKALALLREMSGTDANVLIVSENSFPSGTGLAASAAGAAALSVALSKAFGLTLTQKEMSIIARRVSGSGCRSLFGGFVAWEKGGAKDGSDSIAVQVANENHWPEIIDIVALISEKKKRVPTTEGHKRTVRTSEHFAISPYIAEERTFRAIKAINEKDFNTLAEITMKDSNRLHAICMESYPPIMYLNDRSKAVIEAIHGLNDSMGTNIAAYTFDAGPNPHIITTRHYKDKVFSAIKDILNGNRVIVSGQGSGPRLLAESDSLIDIDHLRPVNAPKAEVRNL